MKEVITSPQKLDINDGFGYVEGAAGCTLKEALDFYAKNSRSWGVVCIHRKGEIVRKFDYDTYNDNIFYHYLLSWEYRFIVKEIKFAYCFMNKDIDIYLE